MKILVTGISGQLGQQIINSAPENINLIGLSRNKLDLRNTEECFNTVMKHRPDWIINAGAYTNVDNAENEKDLAITVNTKAPIAFSQALKKTGGKLLQISTDYVFDGNQKKPYSIEEKTSPINFYGHTKALAEKNIIEELRFSKNYIILRTSCLVSKSDNNFLKKILYLNKEKKIINVVDDQIASLTSTDSLVEACWKAIEKYSKNNFHKNNEKILHFTNHGYSTRYKFATEILNSALKHGLISKKSQINPVKTSNYLSNANRPKYSVLDCSRTYKTLKIKPISWEKSIEDIILKLNQIKK